MITPQDKRRPEKISLLLHPDTAAWLKQYAEQLASDQDYVVTAILDEYRSKSKTAPAGNNGTSKRGRKSKTESAKTPKLEVA